MGDNFVHLHCHTDIGSTLDGGARIDRLVGKVSELGQPAVAITDHGSLSGAYLLMKTAKEAGITPIIGLETYMAPAGTSRGTAEAVHIEPLITLPGAEGASELCASSNYSGRGAYTHMTMLAASQTGLGNLFKFSTESHRNGWYRKPRGDWDLLAECADGLITTTGCPSGEIQTLLRAGMIQQAYRVASDQNDIMGSGNYFVEVMDHGLSIEAQVSQELFNMSKKLGIPLLATNDLHYVESADSRWHEALLALGSGSKLTVPSMDEGGKRFAFHGDSYYVKTASEMRELFKEHPEACDNTLLIAERVAGANITMGTKPLMPKFVTANGVTEEEEFRHKVETGLQARFPGAHVRGDYTSRIRYEMDIITEMGFPGYFLVVSDLVNWAKNQGIAVGPGRGSAAGSLVAWALNITEVDSIRHELLFERFLNPERVSLPDIDIDFDDVRRNEVVDYVVEKYGSDHVANIITFGTMKSKSALRDAARVLDYPYSVGDTLAKTYPDPVMGMNLSFADAFDETSARYAEAEKFRDLVSSGQSRTAFTLAQRFEGLTRGTGLHAAGIIICPDPIEQHVPLMRRTKDSPLSTAFDYPSSEALGLVKMDFLGLLTLGTITRALEQIKANTGDVVSVDNLIATLDDPATYAMLSRGDSVGVFQLDSTPMRALLKRMKPTSFNDISAVLALYRPGPMGANAHNDYADRKNFRQTAHAIHPEFRGKLDEVLGHTHGIIVYQEQVMRIAQVVAGYSLGQADMLRRAMGKKSRVILEKEYAGFLEGARGNGYSDGAVKALWEILVPFADYAFNASHSVAYGMITYTTAYLKANYPTEYMAALLSTNHDAPVKLAVYLSEARSMGINVTVPDVNTSNAQFTAVGDEIRVGLSGIMKVGDGPIEAIIAGRTAGPYESFADFLTRNNGTPAIRKDVVQSLIKAGAFDSLGQHRGQLFAASEGTLAELMKDRTKAKAQAKKVNQFTAVTVPVVEVVIPEAAEWSKATVLAGEKEVLKMFISGHPLDGMDDVLESISDARIVDLLDGDEEFEARPVKLAGLVTAVEVKTAKGSGKPWAAFTLEDRSGSMELRVFARSYTASKNMLVVGSIIAVDGKAKFKTDNNAVDVQVSGVSMPDLRLAALKVARSQPFIVRVEKPVFELLKAEMKELLLSHSGTRSVIIEVRDSTGTVTRYTLPPDFSITATTSFVAEMKALLAS
jgi:DNA polymerase-3 subunit alpha